MASLKSLIDLLAVTQPDHNDLITLLRAFARGNLGAGRVTLSGGNARLDPFSGNAIPINGDLQEIPDAGVTLASPAGTGTPYLYAYMNGSTLTLESSATAYAIQAGTGVPIKSGDATRSLVGLGRHESGAWTQVLSWYNRQLIRRVNAQIGDLTTASVTDVELSTTFARLGFLNWADCPIIGSFSGRWQNNTGSATSFAFMSLDGTGAGFGGQQAFYAPAANADMPLGLIGGANPSEGYHFATLVVHVTAGTMKLVGGAWHQTVWTLG